MLRIHLRASKTLGLLGPPDPRPLVPSSYGARWPFSVLAPVKFRPVSAPAYSSQTDYNSEYGGRVTPGNEVCGKDMTESKHFYE